MKNNEGNYSLVVFYYCIWIQTDEELIINPPTSAATVIVSTMTHLAKLL